MTEKHLMPETETFEKLDGISYYTFGELLNELLFLESIGLGDWKVEDVLDFFMDYIQWLRKRRERSEHQKIP